MCVCVALLKDSITPCVLVLCFREQFSFPKCFSREPYLYQPVSKVCVCVCEIHLKDSVTPSVLVLFREQSMPVGSELPFSENSFMPLAL